MRALLIFALLFLFATNLFASNVGIETVANDIWDKDKSYWTIIWWST